GGGDRHSGEAGVARGGSRRIIQDTGNPRRVDIEGKYAFAIGLKDPIKPNSQILRAMFGTGPPKLCYPAFNFGHRDGRQVQGVGPGLKPAYGLGGKRPFSGAERAEHVGVEQPAGHRSTSRSGVISRSTSISSGIAINRSAKFGRSSA